MIFENPNTLKESDYRDYVFKDGKLVGKFEEMYRDVSDPWWQGRDLNRPEIIHMLKMLKGKKYKKILELGCGHGHVANKLTKFGSVLGVDISQTAVEKAQKLYPNVEFDTCDMIKGLDTRRKLKHFAEKEFFDLIVFSGTLWYVVDYIDRIFSDIDAHLNPNGEFNMNLPFPLTENYYGKEILPNAQSVINYVQKYFDVITGVDIDEEYKKGAPIVIVHAKKRMR